MADPPPDPHDRRRDAHVRPSAWVTTVRPAYDVAVIGGGTAGLVCAAAAAALGARVLLVERARLGGDCLNAGCVPSKALLRAARAVHEARTAARFGVRADVRVEFGEVMASVRARRADIAPHDAAARLAGLGVDVVFGHAAFDGPRALVVDGRRTVFRRAVIATGAAPRVPDLPGLREVPFLTSEGVFDLPRLPEALVVLGGGPAGCELAQAFAWLGSRVTLVEAGPRLLPRDDADASAVLAARLARDGVEVCVGAPASSVMGISGGIRVAAGERRIEGTHLLVAAGRAPALDGLGLDAAGVARAAGGVVVDDRLRTTNPRIFAAGDVCGSWQFTHAADAMARIAVQNALFFGRRRASALAVPWCTLTTPEVAHVGAGAAGGAMAGAVSVTVPLDEVDRAIVDGDVDGFVRVWHRGGRLVGATVVAPRAGEMIGLLALAMARGVRLADLAATVFPYPTVAMALRQAGDRYRRTRLTPGVSAALRRYFELWRRL